MAETLITSSNYSTYFTVSDGTYKFTPGTDGFWTNSNSGISSSTATTTLTAKQPMVISIAYDYGSESSYDKITLTIAGTTKLSAVSGTGSGTYSATLSTGQTIVMKYTKDGSVNSNGDYSKFKITISSYSGKILWSDITALYNTLREIESDVGLSQTAVPSNPGIIKPTVISNLRT